LRVFLLFLKIAAITSLLLQSKEMNEFSSLYYCPRHSIIPCSLPSASIGVCIAHSPLSSFYILPHSFIFLAVNSESEAILSSFSKNEFL
jgi:hypothetical protein